MILTVTPNPALDMTWTIDRIHPGGTHRAESAAVRAGGKGVNVARVLHGQGIETKALVTAGGASGAELEEDLRRSGIPYVAVPVEAPTRRSVAWVDRALGDATIVNEHGAALRPAEWQALEDAVSTHRADAEVLVISGSLPRHAPPSFLPEVVTAGRTAGLDVVVDTSGSALIDAATAGARVLKPNRAELIAATGEHDVLTAARGLVARGSDLILVSLGAEGMLAVTEDTAWRARLPLPLSGNPTGAGDAAVAACAAVLAAGRRDVSEILRTATAWSAAAVLMPLAGEIDPSWTEVEKTIEMDEL